MTVNDRHLAILRRLLELGLRPGLNVLEAGCGAGSVTYLIAGVLSLSGHLTAIDVDENTLALAEANLGHWPNVSIRAADAVTFQSDSSFDLIVLPDLIEHVAPERRADLIDNLAQLLLPEGLMFIHTPNPLYLEWVTRTDPSALQKPVDIAVYPHQLAVYAHNAGLFLHRLENYAVWHKNCDYQAIVLRPVAAASSFA